jgi:hypothetical protein
MQGVTSKTYEVAKHYMSKPFYISSEFGDGRGHRGVDISIPGNADIGEPIYSFLNGYVKRKGYQENGAGHYIVIGQDNGQEQKYMHMHKASPLTIGAKVKAGDVIGQIGNTGQSSGAHLHVEFWDTNGKVLDPLPYLKKWANGEPEQKTNADTYKVVTTLDGYVTAADAKKRVSKVTTVKPGTYYVFNESQGMINVTSKKGVPGSWINPADNKAPSKPKKTIAQMATEVIQGKHGNGHETRRKSLGIDKATYEKVRAEVNRRLL